MIEGTNGKGILCLGNWYRTGKYLASLTLIGFLQAIAAGEAGAQNIDTKFCLQGLPGGATWSWAIYSGGSGALMSTSTVTSTGGGSGASLNSAFTLSINNARAPGNNFPNAQNVESSGCGPDASTAFSITVDFSDSPIRFYLVSGVFTPPPTIPTTPPPPMLATSSPTTFWSLVGLGVANGIAFDSVIYQVDGGGVFPGLIASTPFGIVGSPNGTPWSWAIYSTHGARLSYSLSAGPVASGETVSRLVNEFVASINGARSLDLSQRFPAAAIVSASAFSIAVDSGRAPLSLFVAPAGVPAPPVVLPASGLPSTAWMSAGSGLAAGGNFNATVFADLPSEIPTESEYAVAVREDKPLAYWRFEDPISTDGTRVDNLGSVGQAGDGIYVGNEINLVANSFHPNLGNAVAVDNLGEVNRIDVDHENALDLIGTETATFEAWLNVPETPEDRGVIFDNGWDENNGSYHFGLFEDTGQVSAGVAGTSFAPKGSSLSGSGWRHVVASYDAREGNEPAWKFYIDGVLDGTHSDTADFRTNDSALTLFSHFGGDTDRYSGMADEIAIYDVALTPAQVLAHFEAATASDRIFRIVDLKLDTATGEISLTWTSKANEDFTLEWSPDLGTSGWVRLASGIRSQGRRTSVSLRPEIDQRPNIAEEPHMYFRVLRDLQ